MGQIASVTSFAVKSCLYQLAEKPDTTPSTQCLKFVTDLAKVYQSFSSSSCPRVCELVKENGAAVDLAEALSESLTSLDWFQIAILVLIWMVGAGLAVLIIFTCVIRCENKASRERREARRQQAAATNQVRTTKLARVPPMEHL